MLPSGLVLTGNVAENWKLFKERFELYLEASGGKEIPESTQTSILLHLIGEEGFTIYNTFSYEDGTEKKVRCSNGKI